MVLEDGRSCMVLAPQHDYLDSRAERVISGRGIWTSAQSCGKGFLNEPIRFTRIDDSIAVALTTRS